MPRATSTDISAQSLAPPTWARASSGHVSAPNSPLRGMVRNDQTCAPVRTSKARMSPGADAYSRLVAEPRMIRFSKISPGQAALLLDRRRIAIEPFTQIDHAVLAEGRNRLAGLRVEGAQHVQRAEQQPAIRAVGALPVVHAADREGLDLGRRPQLLAGRRVERDERVAAGPRVDDVADDERVEVGVAVGIRPGDLQLPTLPLVICVAATKRELSGPPA